MILAGISLPRRSCTSHHVTLSHDLPAHIFCEFVAYSLFYYNIFWLSFVIVSLVYILGHGVEYVAWPRLNPPTDFLFYDGPGFKSGNRGKGFKIPFNLDKRLVKGGIKIGGAYTNLTAQHRHSKTEEIEMGIKKRLD